LYTKVSIPVHESLKGWNFFSCDGLVYDMDDTGGWKSKKLHQIGFVDGNDASAFGFIDPADVIRAVHLIPQFSSGRTKNLLGHSIARSIQENDEDWIRYYVNM